MKIAMNVLAQKLNEVIGKESAEAVAVRWSNPSWELKAWRLRDLMRGHTKRPRDPRDLTAIAEGAGWRYEDVLVWSYTESANGDSPATGDS